MTNTHLFSFNPPVSRVRIQSRLLKLAGIFIFLFALALTLSPAARERSWLTPLRWSHWLGFIVWVVVYTIIQSQVHQHLPDTDPYFLPIAALLSGWGLLTIWRLDATYGIRQTLWLTIGGVLFSLGLRLNPSLPFLRRYKYLWLTGGLLLTAFTLIFGTNPMGSGPRLWLGCCGIYFQSSEPLKLLLVIYLAAYFSDRLPLNLRPLPLLAPTAFVTSLALLLLIVQRDLGTASIFIFLYTMILYIASGRKRLLLISLVGISIAGLIGYFFFDVVRLRMEAWINPWLDPSGRSYQIVQSLLAIANGGLFGRGPGLGSPSLVPVAISDFIFTAIAEETGLIGTLALLLILGFLFMRGVRVSLHAPDRFRRILSAGLTAYLGIQSLFIIGGNLRLLPLTGVTLPFLSYGGSSLLTSLIAILLLLLISSQPENEPAVLSRTQPYLLLSGILCVSLFTVAIVNGWWAIWRGPDLLTRTDNARRSIADRYVARGALLDQNENPINNTQGKSGSYVRVYEYPELAPITGYTHPIYGQAGLESTLDSYLRGIQGYPASLIWWNQLLYGQPPPGLDVRLSLDLEFQQQADSLLGNHAGAIVLLNAKSGEIIVMASHPSYDPNTLDLSGLVIAQDAAAPLLNRTAQGQYPLGTASSIFYEAQFGITQGSSFSVSEFEIQAMYESLGFYTSPNLRLPVALMRSHQGELYISPLQMALAVAALSNNGMRPALRLAMAVNTPAQGWVILPALGEPVQALSPQSAMDTTLAHQVDNQNYWVSTGRANQSNLPISWFLAGTLPEWKGTPLALVVLIEEENPALTYSIGQTMINRMVQP